MMKALKKKRKGGFTLIELIVVIAILGILAIIAIPRFIGTLDNARTRADDSTARVIQSAVNLYMADNDGAIPALGNLTPNYLDPAVLEWSDGDAITAITVDLNGIITGFTAPRP